MRPPPSDIPSLSTTNSVLNFVDVIRTLFTTPKLGYLYPYFLFPYNFTYNPMP